MLHTQARIIFLVDNHVLKSVVFSVFVFAFCIYICCCITFANKSKFIQVHAAISPAAAGQLLGRCFDEALNMRKEMSKDGFAQKQTLGDGNK